MKSFILFQNHFPAKHHSDEVFYYLQAKEGQSHLVSGERDLDLQAWKVHQYLKIHSSQGQ